MTKNIVLVRIQEAPRHEDELFPIEIVVTKDQKWSRLIGLDGAMTLEDRLVFVNDEQQQQGEENFCFR